MKSKLLSDTASEKSWVVVFDTGDEAMGGLLAFARDQQVTAAHFTAIGAFSRAVLGYFDWQSKQYQRTPVDEQVEVVSLVGDIAQEGENPKIHAHAALAKRGGTMSGGHLLEGHVRPTLEVVVTASPKRLERKFDQASGIALIRT